MRVGWLAALLAVLGAAPPPAVALDPDLAITQYGMKAWKEGLPQASVTAMAQTADRYLWLGTQEGLVRFDGESFEVHDRRRHPQLPSSWIFELLATRDGSLWISTNEGLARRNPDGTYERVEVKGMAPGPARLAEDSEGVVWAGTRSGLWSFKDRVVVGQLAQPDSHEGDLHALAAGRGGGIWWSDEEGTIFRRTATGTVRRWVAGQDIPRIRPTAMLSDREDACWVVSFDGLLLRISGEGVRSYGPADGLPAARLVSLTVDRRGNVWIASHGAGLIRLSGGRFSALGPDNGLGDTKVTSVMEDQDGNLLVGTQAAGLVRLADVPFRTFGEPEGLRNDNVMTLLAEPDGSMLVGSSGAGLFRVRAERVVREPVTALGLETVTSLLRDRAGRLWAGTENRGLARWDGAGAPTWIGSAQGLKDSHVTALVEGTDGTIWVGTEGRGVHRVRGAEIAPPGPEAELDRAWVTAMTLARDGALWIATNGSGLARLQGDTLQRWTMEQGLATNALASLHEDATGSLWIGTVGSGLLRMRDGRVQRVSEAEGLFDDVVLAIVEDRRGDLWLSSNRGVTRASRRAVEAVLDAGGRARFPSRTYARTDGMRTAECNGGQQHSGVLDRAGRVWMATARGAVAFEPDRVEGPARPPPSRIERVEADGTVLRIADPSQVRVPPGSNRVEFRFSAPDFVAPSQLRFQFRMDGWDKGWIDAREARAAVYTALPPGDHVFRVRARFEGAEATGLEAALPVRFEPFLWQRWWFRLAAVAAIAGGVWSLLRARVRALRRRQEELEAIVTERTRTLAEEKERSAAASRAKTVFLATMSHEIRTPLNGVLGFASHLEERLQDPGDRGNAARIREAAETLARIVNDVLDASRIEAGQLHMEARPFAPASVIGSSVSLHRAEAESKGLAFVVENRVPEGLVLEGDPARIRQVVSNLLSNAVKFTTSGSVTVAAGAHPEGPGRQLLRVEVRDTGIGVSDEQRVRIFQPFSQGDSTIHRRFGGTGLGLHLARQFLEAMGGSITLRSSLGQGSTFAFEVVLEESSVPVAGTGAIHAETRPLRVLVVDDGVLNRALLRALLTQDGHAVEEAEDGSAALMKVGERTYDAILMDLDLPDVSGLEVAMAIRGEPGPNQRTPIVAVTGMAFDSDVAATRDAGMDEHLAKPVSAADLRRVMGRLGRNRVRP